MKISLPNFFEINRKESGVTDTPWPPIPYAESVWEAREYTVSGLRSEFVNADT